MGIKGFQNFLKQYNGGRLATTMYIRDSFLVIDGSEIMYELWNKCETRERGSYRAYREKIMEFFTNLEVCGIQPVVIFDGFKFEDHRAYYISKRNQKIEWIQKAINNGERSAKAYLCHLVFKQTLHEMNVIWSTARNDTDADAVALSRLLNAPILASDTNFCTYNLEAGFLQLSQFRWENVSNRNTIEAVKYQIDNFASHFGIERKDVSLLAALFDNHEFERFKAFRNQTFGRGNWNQRLKTCLEWLSRNTNSLEKTINIICPSDDIRGEILEKINIHENPSIRDDLLQELAEKIPEEKDRLLSAQSQDNPEENISRGDHFFNTLMKRTYAGKFPYWAIAILQKLDEGKEIINYLPLIFTEPSEFESPHEITRSIRKVSYQLLLHISDTDDNAMVVREFDRVMMKYQELPSVSIKKNLDLAGLMLKSNTNIEILEKRKDYLLSTMIVDEEKKKIYENNLSKISDDLKLCLSATIFWKAKVNPDENVLKAFALVFALLQWSCKGERENVEANAFFLKFEATRNLSREKRLDLIQLLAQWQACLYEVISLNQILDFPILEPIISSHFDEDMMEIVYKALDRRMSIESNLKNITEAQKLYEINCQVLLH